MHKPDIKHEPLIKVEYAGNGFNVSVGYRSESDVFWTCTTISDINGNKVLLHAKNLMAWYYNQIKNQETARELEEMANKA